MNTQVVIFVGGVSRSGTSLFSQLFDGHPQVMAFSDEVQFLKLAPKLKRWRNDPEQYLWHILGRPYDWDEMKKLPLETKIDPEVNLKFYGPWEAIRRSSGDLPGDQSRIYEMIENGATAKELFLTLAEIYARCVADHETPDIILEKTPGNEFQFRRYRAYFPKTRFVHLVRDPFDNLRSRVARQGNIVADKINWPGLVNMSFEWKRSLLCGLKNFQLAPKEYRMVRYEDLIADPETVLTELCEFLQIEYHDCLLRQTRNGGRDLVSNCGHEGIHRSGGVIDKKALAIDANRTLGAR